MAQQTPQIHEHILDIISAAPYNKLVTAERATWLALEYGKGHEFEKCESCGTGLENAGRLPFCGTCYPGKDVR